MTTIEAFSLAASVVSILVTTLLGIVAIWLSLHFYAQTKNTESRVEIALEGIKTQTDTLQKIIGRSLDRFTKFVTTPRDESSNAVQILQMALREMPELAQQLRGPDPQTLDPAARARLIDLHIAVLYYTAEANIWASMMLPTPDAFDREDSFQRLTEMVIDRSYNDFQFVLSVIDNVDADVIAASSVAHLHHEATATLRPLVHNTAGHFVRKSAPPGS